MIALLHVEQHTEEEELETGDDEERREDRARARDAEPRDLLPDEKASVRGPACQKRHTEEVEEDERVEVPEDVLRPESPEEAAEQHRRDPERVPDTLDLGLTL